MEDSFVQVLVFVPEDEAGPPVYLLNDEENAVIRDVSVKNEVVFPEEALKQDLFLINQRLFAWKGVSHHGLHERMICYDHTPFRVADQSVLLFVFYESELLVLDDCHVEFLPDNLFFVIEGRLDVVPVLDKTVFELIWLALGQGHSGEVREDPQPTFRAQRCVKGKEIR